jgi:hypothetical protein
LIFDLLNSKIVFHFYIDVHPFNKGRSQNVHNKQKMVSTIGNRRYHGEIRQNSFVCLEQRLVNPLVNKKVVSIREEQLTFGKLLGEGNFGKVYAGEYREEHGKIVSCLSTQKKSFILIGIFSFRSL